MNTAFKLLVVDDHNLFREGLHALLQGQEEFQIIGEAASLAELNVHLGNGTVPDLILMDINLPDGSGVEETRRLKAERPEIRIVGLTMHDDESHIIGLTQAGANGYLLKNTTREELLECLRTVVSGGSYFSNKIAEVMLRQYMRNGTPPPRGRHRPVNPNEDLSKIHLTEREREILIMVSQEMTSQEIAKHLSISVRTVDNHRYKLMLKLNVKSAAGLTRCAMRMGLVD
jgi:DNA-binding NarL/FixJ family response regulator